MSGASSRMFNTRTDKWTVLTLSSLILGVLLRLLFLDSDPLNDFWRGYIVDEGRWTELAREWALFGTPDLDSLWSRLHLVIAPGYQAITAVSFSVLGVGFTSARLVSALSGIGLLVAALAFMRRRSSAAGLAVLALSLAIQPDLLFLSRVAIPEMAAMLFEFLAFATLISRPGSPTRAFGAGLLTAAALAVKATVGPFVLVLLAAALVVHRVERGRWGGPWLGAYVAGIVGPALVALLTAPLILGQAPELQLGSVLGTLAGLLETPTVSGVGRTLLGREHATGLYVFLVPMWAIAGSFFVAGNVPPHPARAAYLGSAAWALGWLAVGSVVTYFPPRYLHHVFVPLAINVGAGLTLLQELNGRTIVDRIGSASGLNGWLVRGWFAAPTAALLLPVVLPILVMAGFQVDRLFGVTPFVTLLCLNLGLAHALARPGVGSTARVVLLGLPLVFVPLWFVVGLLDPFPDGFLALAAWDAAGKAALLGAAGTLAWLSYHALDGRSPAGRIWYSYPLVFAGLWLVQVAPGYRAPTYTIAEAADVISELVTDSSLVGAAASSTLFLGTRHRYTEALDRPPLPEIVVAAVYEWQPPSTDTFALVQSLNLNIGACRSSCPPPQRTVRIFRRKR